MVLDDAGVRTRFLIHDRDAIFRAGFDEVFTVAAERGGGALVPILARGTDRPHADLEHPHLIRLLREYEAFYNDHRPHLALGQAAPLRPLPQSVIDLDAFRVSRRDRAGGLLHEYRHVA